MLTTKRKLISITLIFLALGAVASSALALGGFDFLAPQEEDSGPASAHGVDPAPIPDNPDCTDLGYGFGFKIDGQPVGDDLVFYFSTGTQNGLSTVFTGGAPEDPLNSVTIDSDGTYFDWSSTLGLDVVIVKGGPNANTYLYIPEATSDNGLHAPLNSTNNSPYAISHIEFCYDYELSATKTAHTVYTRTYTWTIAKSVAPSAHSGFAGESFISHYDVFVDRTVTDSDIAVSGSITVTNPSPYTVPFSVSDTVAGNVATVSCPAVSLEPNDGAPGGADEVTCTYSAGLDTMEDGTNTATVTSTNPPVAGATAEAPYAFGDPTTVVGYPAVNVSDSVQGALGSTDTSQTFEYIDEFACPTYTEFYDEGVYSFEATNTATIDETGQSDSTKVVITCYAPVVTKDAFASYDSTHTWSLLKSVEPGSQSGYEGDTLTWTWLIDVSETSASSNFAVSGTISVYNPAPVPMTVEVSDMLDDGTVAAVDCGGGSTSLTVAAGTTATCTYSAAPAGLSATQNTATASINGSAFSGTFPVEWVATVFGGTALVSDDQIGLDQTLTAGSGPWSFTGTGSHTCSTNAGDYGSGGTYTGSESNTATLTDSENTSTSSSATTTYTCQVVIQPTACTRTQGYWKTHSKYGPAPYDETWAQVGEDTSFYLSAQTYYQVMLTQPKGNTYYQLAHQYIAALLNGLAGSPQASISGKMSRSVEIFQTYTPEQIEALKGNDPLRQEIIAIAETLDQYNNGLIGPGHCSD